MPLTPEGCRARQERFLAHLEDLRIPAAVISHPRDIYYLTGLFPESPFPYPSLLFLGPGLPGWIVSGLEGEGVFDELLPYPINTLATMNPDNHRRAAMLVRQRILRTPGLARLGYQREALPHSLAEALEAGGPREWTEVDEILQELQLRKGPDEVECIRRSIAANLAGYTRAQQLVRPGANEMEVLTEAQAAAQRHTGKPHFFNGDFQSGVPGGFARDRAIERGELYIIDAWTDLDGYWCDMSRAWVVGGEPTDLQASVYEHLAGILKAVPQMARVGRSTVDLWHELDARIREHPHMTDKGLIHHGGHGIGLRAHEGPDLNRDRGGVFEVGNVFTCEPGFYSEELRGGVRLENDFLVTESGVEVLSEYPLSLASAG